MIHESCYQITHENNIRKNKRKDHNGNSCNSDRIPKGQRDKRMNP